MAEVTKEQLRAGLEQLSAAMPQVQANAMYEAGIKVGKAMGQKALLEQLVKADDHEAEALKLAKKAESESDDDPTVGQEGGDQ